MAAIPITQEKIRQYILLAIIILIIFYIIVKKILGTLAGTPLG